MTNLRNRIAEVAEQIDTLTKVSREYIDAGLLDEALRLSEINLALATKLECLLKRIPRREALEISIRLMRGDLSDEERIPISIRRRPLGSPGDQPEAGG